MKIVFIGQKGIPTRIGGIERHAEELAIRLAEKGNEVLVYTRPNYTDKNLKEYKGVKLISLPTIASKHLDAIFHTFLACLDVSLRKDVSVIHFHSIGPCLLIWLAKLFNPFTPVVATFHSQCYRNEKWGFFAKMSLKVGEYFCCKFSDELITVSKNLRDYVWKEYQRKAIYVPNGVPMYELVSPLKMKKWGLKKNGYFFFAGRLIRLKGVHHLILAFNQIKTNKKLVITGEGEYGDGYAEKLKKMVQGNENIIFTGKIDGTDSELAELFSNAFVFVHPSETEGLSIALLETMSYGVPPLASDIPENIEAVGEAGFFFENLNAEDLASQMQKLEDNPDLVANKREIAKKRVLNNYSWDEVSDSVLDVYENSLKVKLEKNEERC